MPKDTKCCQCLFRVIKTVIKAITMPKSFWQKLRFCIVFGVHENSLILQHRIALIKFFFWHSHASLFLGEMITWKLSTCHANNLCMIDEHEYSPGNTVLVTKTKTSPTPDLHIIQGLLTGGNWQKWKRVFLTCPCHEIYRDEAVGLKSCKNTWKITIFVKMWNLGQYRENLIFCQ